MLDVSRDDITDGPLTRALLVLAAPLIVQNLTQIVQQTVDTFWVGQLGSDHVAAIGLVIPVVQLLFFGIVGLLVGTQVIVSQRVGSGDASGARRAAFHGVVLGFGFGTILAAAVSFGAPGIVRLFGVEPTVAPLATQYLAVFGLTFIPLGLSDTLEGGFIGWGDSRAALYINLVAVGVNVVLDPFLIFGWWLFPELGIRGAALASVVGYVAGLALAVGMVVRGRDGFTFTRRSLRIDRSEFREILDVSWPTAGQHAASQSARVAMVGLVSAVAGPAGLAAYTVGARVAAVAYIPASGLQQAAQSVIGQNLGADKPARASRTTWVGAAIAAAALSVFAVAQWLVPGAIARLFIANPGPDVLAYTVAYLQILAYGYWAIGAAYLFLAGFNGARRTRTSLIARLLQYWVVRIPIAVVGAFAFGYGVYAVFWAVTISNVVAAVGAGAYYHYSTSNGMLERAVEVATAD